MIIWYDEERKAKVNSKDTTIEDIENMTLNGDYCGFIIGGGKLVGVEHYEEA